MKAVLAPTEATMPMLDAYSRVISAGSELDGSMVYRAMIGAAQPVPAQLEITKEEWLWLKQPQSAADLIEFAQEYAARCVSAAVSNYSWLLNHYRFANDSMQEIWFDASCRSGDSPAELDASITNQRKKDGAA